MSDKPSLEDLSKLNNKNNAFLLDFNNSLKKANDDFEIEWESAFPTKYPCISGEKIIESPKTEDLFLFLSKSDESVINISADQKIPESLIKTENIQAKVKIYLNHMKLI